MASIMRETERIGPGAGAVIPTRGPVPALVLILLAGALARLALWFWFRGHTLQIWDERDYNVLACTLARSGEFAFEPGQPVSIRPPLYPALLAGFYRLFGIENYQSVRLFQAGLSLGTVVIVYRLGCVAASRNVGLIAAGLCCFYPSLLVYNNLILTEVVFTFLLATGCYSVIVACLHHSAPRLLLGGFLWGLAALTRSVLWLFPLVACVWLLLVWRGPVGRCLLAAAILLAGFLVPVVPWAMRNTALQKTLVVVDVMGGRNFMMGNYRHTPLYRAWDAISIVGEKSWDREVRRTYPPSAHDTQGKLDKLALRSGLRFVWKNPGLTLKRDFIKFLNFWQLERELIAGAGRGHYGRVPVALLILATIVIFGSYALAVLTGVFGMVLAPSADRRVHTLLLLVMAFICGMHTLTFGHSRYHLPLIPLILVYSSGALVHARDIWSNRQTAVCRLVVCLCAALILGWVWEIVVVDLHRYLDLMRG